MTEAQAVVLFDFVSAFLGQYPDRHLPFHDQERKALFQGNVLAPAAHLPALINTSPDDRMMVAFMALLSHEHVPPPQYQRDHLLLICRCAFRRASTRLDLIPSHVLAWACGNWGGAAVTADVVAEAKAGLLRITMKACHDAEIWIRGHVYGAAAHAPTIGNVLEFVARLTGERQPILIVPGAALNILWHGDQLSIPQLGIGALSPGSKRVFTTITPTCVHTPNGNLTAPGRSRIILASRSERLNITVEEANGRAQGKRLRIGQPAAIIGPAELQQWSCTCGGESCDHRHTLGGWSPHGFLRLRLPQAHHVDVRCNWNGSDIAVECLTHRIRPRALSPGCLTSLAFSGLSQPGRVTVASPNVTFELSRHKRLRLTASTGSLTVRGPVQQFTVAAGEHFSLHFQNTQDDTSIGAWGCSCGMHAYDPWILPPRTDVVNLSSYIASALKGPALPVGHKSFPQGMYFALAADLGFDAGGRLQNSDAVLVNRCVCGTIFQGALCPNQDCGITFDRQTMRRFKDDRVMLVGIAPPPYSRDEFLKCECGNFFQVEDADFVGRNPYDWCAHALQRQPLADRLAGAVSELDRARVLERLREEASECPDCGPIAGVPWCPIRPHGPVDKPLPERVTHVWL